MSEYQCPECDKILPSSIYAHVCTPNKPAVKSKEHPLVQAFYDVDKGRFEKQLKASGFNLACVKCSYLVASEGKGYYRCHCLGSCPDVDLSTELKEHLLKTVRTREFYYLQHKLCPQCFSDDYAMTTLGIVFIDYESYKDTNRVTCKCGYVGKSHDCVPERKK